MKSLKQNNFAFIDAQNVHLAITALGWQIDWTRFRIYLKEKYNIEKAFLFIGYIEGNNHIYTRLQEAGFVCIFKPTLRYKNGTTKGNCDAELVLHAMLQYNNFDKALIVTGDGDFYCLVQHLLSKSKLLAVMVPNQQRYSALLKRFAQKHIMFMNNLKKKIGKR